MKIRKTNLFTVCLIVAIIAGSTIASNQCQAQKVKHCKNLRTGDVIVVEVNYPCPSGTVKI